MKNWRWFLGELVDYLYYVGDFYEDPNTMMARPLNKFIESGIEAKIKT